MFSCCAAEQWNFLNVHWEHTSSWSILTTVPTLLLLFLSMDNWKDECCFSYLLLTTVCNRQQISVYKLHRHLTNTWEGGVTEDRRDSFLPFLPVREAAAPYVWGLLSPAWHLNSLHVATSPGCLFLPRSSPAVPSWPLDLRRSVQSAGGHVLARDAKRRDTCLCRVVHRRRLSCAHPRCFVHTPVCFGVRLREWLRFVHVAFYYYIRARVCLSAEMLLLLWLLFICRYDLLWKR